MHAGTRSLSLVAALLLAGGCSRAEPRGQDGSGAPRGAGDAQRPAGVAHPLDALRMTGDAIAARAGPFAWEGTVTWSIERPGVTPVRAAERHRVRQLATGEFAVSSDIDPGAGPGSETGKQVVFAGGVTYGRARWAPFRERPTDRGNGARRFRDETLQMAADLADLYGPALAAEPWGEITYAGRRARRYRLTLSGAAPSPSPPPPTLPDGGYDPDTRRRVAFLEGRVPAAAEGELVLDAETGVPLSVALRGSFSEKDDPQLRADVDLTARIEALGAAVAPVHAPKGALADVRRSKGIARALEAAGLRQRAAERRAPADEDEPPEE